MKPIDEHLFREQVYDFMSDVKVHPNDTEEIKIKRNEVACAYHRDLRAYSKFDIFASTVTGAALGGWAGVLMNDGPSITLASMFVGGVCGYKAAQASQFPRTGAEFKELEQMIKGSAIRYEIEQPHNLDISFEGDRFYFVPEEFKRNPFGYFESRGINIKKDEKKIEDGQIKEDPTAVKILPKWSYGSKEIIPVAKRVNTAKGQVGRSNNPLYEYEVIKYVRSLGLPAPKPILSVKQNNNYMFLTEKVQGMNWYEKSTLRLSERDAAKLMAQAEEQMNELSRRFHEKGIVRPWKLNDMVFDLDMRRKTINSIVPVDFERTTIQNNQQ